MCIEPPIRASQIAAPVLMRHRQGLDPVQALLWLGWARNKATRESVSWTTLRGQHTLNQ